ncbi:MAG: ABC transporter permease [Bacteroidetes bacterium]|nr:ABC transporter permease [Bacteroidota bacterium]
MNLPFFIARRSLIRQKGNFSSFIVRLAVLATGLSVAVMIVAVALISGFKYQIQNKLFSFWGHVHITEFNPNAANLITTSPILRNDELIHRLKALPHVLTVVPYAVRPAILQFQGAIEGIKLKGIDSFYRLPKTLSLSGSSIRFSDTAYSKEIVLSQSTAKRLNLKIGDPLLLAFLDPGAIAPRIRKVRLSGTFHTGMDEVDREFGICDIRLLQHINNWRPDYINGYQIDLDNPLLSDTLSTVIYNDYVEAPLTTSTIKEIYPNVFDWLQLLNVNAQVVLVIMSVVAIINLAVALLILIVEQARLVALLKALGMSYAALRKLFLYYGGFIALFGILLGNVLGLGLCWFQSATGIFKLSETSYYMSEVPVYIHWGYVLAIDLATFLICILCLWLPSLYIRKIRPAKLLQFK